MEGVKDNMKYLRTFENVESKWIIFKEIENNNPTAKTKIFAIYPKSNISITLGTIKWFGNFRKYCFFPSPNCIFETQCLTDIIDFINALMEDRKHL